MFVIEWLILSIIGGTILGGATVVGIWSLVDKKDKENKYEIINDDFKIYDTLYAE